ncbi:CASP-like protein 4C2 [Syzygium oleosum]|uniref:CASP-like protein 4C2 n=1 Tax=Syzygium oleosum TaxID=219896 RepID=UPI0011D2BD2F|nr:CASP-like protein 4C2 [Syzygium oleosum]
MRSPPPLPHHSPRNGDAATPPHHHHPHRHDRQYQSTVSVQKLRRFNWLILVLRLAAFCFALASSIFSVTNSRGPSSPHWYDFEALRYLFVANAMVALYSLFETGASVWEILKNATLFPETFQLWFDFSHDQVFAYVLISAESAGMALARTLKGSDTCTASSAFCIQSDIAIALGFAGFLFLAFSSLLSGFRLVCFLINGSRFPH